MPATLLTPRGEQPTAVPPPRAPITNATRLAWRQLYGDFPSLIQAAEFEAAQRRIDNAVVIYQAALAQWLRDRWIQHCGRPGSTIDDPQALTEKLRSGGVLDRWLFNLVRTALSLPVDPGVVHLEIVSAVVRAVSLEPVANAEGGDVCPAA